MLHSRDHDRRRRTASSSDDDDDDDGGQAYEDPAAAQQADVALARLAEHVFRRRRPLPPANPDDDSGSSSSCEEEIVVNGELEPAAEAVTVDEDVDEASPDQGEQESAAPEVADQPIDAIANVVEGDDVVGDETTTAAVTSPSGEQDAAAEPRTQGRREFVEPPIPEGRKYRFYMHDSRADDDDDRDGPASPAAAAPPPTSRADCEWKHDLFQRLLEEPRRPPRRHPAQGDRPRHRWVAKGARQQLPPPPPSDPASVQEWAQPGADWKPDGYDAHAKTTKRWVPKTTTTTTTTVDEPDLQSSWSVPEPVKASEPDTEETPQEEDAPQVEPAATPSPGLNPEAPAVTIMNPEAREFQLPTAEDEIMYPASIDYCWVYDDGAVMPAPGVFDYVYEGADPAAQPYYFYADPYVPPAPVDDARNVTTAATSE